MNHQACCPVWRGLTRSTTPWESQQLLTVIISSAMLMIQYIVGLIFVLCMALLTISIFSICIHYDHSYWPLIVIDWNNLAGRYLFSTGSPRFVAHQLSITVAYYLLVIGIHRKRFIHHTNSPWVMNLLPCRPLLDHAQHQANYGRGYSMLATWQR